MRKLFFSLVFSLGVLAFSLIVAQQRHTVFADTSTTSSQESALSGITFPVAELGNCASRDECRTYCDQTEHMNACITFAKAHGLMSKDEETKSQEFAHLLQSGGGPGGCTSPETCRAFCSTIQNISACVSFAKEHNFKDGDLSRAEKIQQFIQGGGTMPGGCTSKDSCEAYCSDFSHAQVCQAFAQKVGITDIENRGQEKIPSGQFQKLLELIKENKTPGQCTSADSCEAYCKDPAHQTECLAFAKEVGFVTPEQADKIEKLGGKGPGGCDSEDSCKAYCNDQTHQTECLQFAKDHGLLSSDEAEHAQNALVRIREGLSNAPEEVQQCLSSTVGRQTIQDIEAGNVAPSPSVGQQVQECFQNFGEKEDPNEPVKQLHGDVADCVKQKVGTQLQQIQQGTAQPTPDTADAIRACTQLKNTENENDAQGVQQNLQHMLESAPPSVRTCLQDQQQVIAQTRDPEKLKEIAHQCFDQFHVEKMNPSSKEQNTPMENEGEQKNPPSSMDMEHMQNDMKQMLPLQPNSGEGEQMPPSGNAPAPQIPPAPLESQSHE